MNPLNYEQIRDFLSAQGKLMRSPNGSEINSDSLYIRAIWQRIGGLLKTGDQESVANILGFSLSSLKRYMTKEGSCPYVVQFALESLAGIPDSGTIYKISGDNRVCQVLLPFAATLSSGTQTYLAMGNSEPSKLLRLVENTDININIEIAYEYIQNHPRPKQ